MSFVCVWVGGLGVESLLHTISNNTRRLQTHAKAARTCLPCLFVFDLGCGFFL